MAFEDVWVTIVRINRTASVVIDQKAELDLGVDDRSSYDAEFYFTQPIETDAGGTLRWSQEITSGRARIVFHEREEKLRAILSLNQEWVYQTAHSISAELAVSLPDEAEKLLLDCNSKNLSIRCLFRCGAWEEKYGLHNYGTVEEVSIFNSCNFESELTVARNEQIEKLLLRNFSGDRSVGQMPNVCRDIASCLVKHWNTELQADQLEKAYELLGSLRWINQFRDGELTEKVELIVEKQFNDLYTEFGERLAESLLKLNDQRLKSRFLEFYNQIYVEQNPSDAVKYNHSFNEHNLQYSVELYTSENTLYSRHLNRIFLEALIIYQIRQTADRYLRDSCMSIEAQDCIHMTFYDADKVKVKGKSGWKLYLWGLGSLFESLALLIVVGLGSWGLAALLSDDNELAHYILFASFFSTWFIVRRLNRRDPVNTEKDNEEKAFYVLKDLCNLHNKVATEDTKLLRSLMINLELRGVSFDERIYKILCKMEQHTV